MIYERKYFIHMIHYRIRGLPYRIYWQYSCCAVLCTPHTETVICQARRMSYYEVSCLLSPVSSVSPAFIMSF